MSWLSLADTCSSPSSCQPSVLAFVALITQYLYQSFDSRYTDKNFIRNEIDNQEFDFIIVGAGSAGSVVANRLSEIKEWKVLLLEVGDEEPLLAEIPALTAQLLSYPKINHAYNTVPENTSCGQRSSTLWVGRVMGGTSSINGRRYIRGSKQDYDDWAKAVGDHEWDWEHVLPYFKKSEDMRDFEVLRKSPFYHGTGGYLTIENDPYEDEHFDDFLNGWKELGFEEVDYNAGSQLGTSRTQFTTIHGSRQSANGAFIRPIRGKRSNLVIRTNSLVTKVIVDPVSKQAKGVEFIDLKNNNTVKVFARKEVIVSSGGFASPKLLMLSGIGPAEHLQELGINVINDLPVGKTLNDHITVTAFDYEIQRNDSTSLTAEDLQNDLVYWLNTHEGPLSSSNAGQSLTYLQTKYAKEPGQADAGVFFIKTMSETPSKSSDTEYSYFDGLKHNIELLDTIGTGQMKLNKDNPIWGDPIITTNFINFRNIEVLVEAAKISGRLTKTQAFKNSGLVLKKDKNENCKDFEFGSDDYLRCAIACKARVADHFSATCKMGSKDDPSAVVDTNLRVYGIVGLRVIDASIIPVLPKASLNAPAIMIGEKGSDMIKKEWLL